MEERPGARGGAVAHRRPLPLVGREAETHTLRAWIDDIRAGHGGAMCLVGEAGLGKTRLAREALDRAEDFLCLRGGALRPEGNADYAALAAGLRSLRRQPHPLSRREVQDLFQFHAGPLQALLPELASAGGPPDPHYPLPEALLDLFLDLAGQSPLVLFFDDAQFLDLPTVDVLAALVREGTRHRVGVLVTCRDGDLDPAGPLAERLVALRQEPNVQTLLPRRLDENGLAALAAAQLECTPAELPDGLLDRLDVESHGNPFFAAEALIYWLNEGNLRRAAGRWRFRPPQRPPLTPPLAQRILARAQRLPLHLREVLEATAALGETFVLMGDEPEVIWERLAEAMPRDRAEVHAWMEELQARQFLRESDEPHESRWAQEPMQEAFYRAMPEERRVHWHRRWAETLQARNRRGQGSNWWQVGSQFSLLGDAVETYAEWSQQPDPWRFPPPSWQAQEHCQRLAEHYFGLSEEQQAQHLYLALRARLLWVFHRWQSGDVGRLLHRPLSFGHYPDRSASENERLYARDLARQAVAHLWLGDYQEVGRCLEGVVRHLFVVSHDSGVVENGTTVPDYKRPDPMVDSENLRDLHLLLKLLRAEWLEAQGRYGELVDWHVTALDEVDRRAFKADDAGRWAWEALGRRADCYRGRQREMPGPSHNPCYVLVWDAGLSDVLLREWRAAARFYAGALDQAESAARETIRWWLVRRDLATYCDVDRPPHACPAFGHAVLARVLRWRDPAVSQQQWQDALYWAEEYEYLGHLGPRYRLGLAQTLWVLGEREEADVLLEEVGQTARHQRNVFLEECSLRDRAGLALERQAWDQAAELCAEAGSLQGQTGVLYNRVREQVYRSVLARAGGDLAAAEAHIEAALAEGERLFHLLQRGFLHAEAARVYHALGRGDLSEQHAAMAREVFGRYAAQPLIEALDADLRRSAAALAPQRTADEKVEADLTPGPSPDRPGEGREAALAFRLLGRFELRRSGQTLTPADWGSRKARTLCKYLLLHADQPVPREVLMELCWPDQRVSQAERNLNTALHTLRQVLEPDRPHGAASRYLRSESGTVVFHLNPDVWVDVQAFERLARRARQHARAGEPDAGAAAWEAALALYGGDLLPEEVYEDWCAAARERLRETYMQGLVELARYRYEQGDDETALQWCQEALAHSPCLEAAARQLMLCLARLGRPNEALTTFQRLAKAMQRELGAEPEPATLALALRLCEGGTV